MQFGLCFHDSMDMLLTGLFISYTILPAYSQVVKSCYEPSTDACRLLDQSIPNFCSGALAPLECPSYCGLCKLTCYQCTQINDPSTCYNNVTCSGPNERCIVSETIGNDFSYHFNLGCVDQQFCSTDLPHVVVVGKRGIQKRNLQFGCCDSNLCNNVLPKQLRPLTPHSCPAGTFEYRDGLVHICYYAILTMQNASQSNLECQRIHRSGRLAYIPSGRAEEFMEKSLASQFGNERGHGVWIGVYDIDQEKHFTDTDGDPQKYFNWRHDQPNDPNNNVPNDPAQDCVRSFPHDRQQFSWQDKPCEQDGLAVCSINIHK